MAKYTSRYAELGFYVKGELRNFTGGVYVTNDPDEIAALANVVDAVPADEPKPEATVKPAKPSGK